MNVANLLGTTLRQAPADAGPASHQLLLRAGYVRQLGHGLFSLLPLARRVMRRIEHILREEMDGIGGQEVSLPVVHPAEVWRQSGRWDTVGPELVRFEDRRGASHCLALSHEEVVAQLAASELSSWRQLPVLVYQIQTKVRDEPRARGGLVRVREFVMKDSYSIDRDEAGLRVQYEAHRGAYRRIFERCGLPVIEVSSDNGIMGGSEAHEYMFLTPIGEDRLAVCDASAANLEVARFRREPVDHGAPEALERIPTPGASTIDALAEQTGRSVTQLGKHVMFEGRRKDGERRLIVVIVRGDREVNPVAVARLAEVTDLRPADPDQLRAVGIEPGYASVVGLTAEQRGQVFVIADDGIPVQTNWIVGANERDVHFVGAQLGRDFQADVVGPVAMAFEGACDEQSGEPLRVVRGVEVGNIFQLGRHYTDAVGATWLDEQGRPQSFVMGSYGIGVGRLLACLAEHHRDEHGLAWPIAVAPFEVQLVAIGKGDGPRQEVAALAEQLRAEGLEVLVDDRDVGAGSKLADADLRGLPLRVVVGERGLKKGVVELKRRLASWRHEGPGSTSPGEVREVPLGAVVAAVVDETRTLRTR